MGSGAVLYFRFILDVRSRLCDGVGGVEDAEDILRATMADDGWELLVVVDDGWWLMMMMMMMMMMMIVDDTMIVDYSLW